MDNGNLTILPTDNLTPSTVGVWDGPPRFGLDHWNRRCRARMGARLMIIREQEGIQRMMVQFDSLMGPQHLECLPSDVARDPPIDWSEAE